MPTFAEIEPLSLSDRVINALKDAFFAGELKPGDAIVERELARQMKVGTPVVREALISLQGQGFVRRVTNTGTFVTQFTTAEIHQLYTLRVELELLADGVWIRGAPGGFGAGTIDSHGDHRFAMAFATAAVRARGPIEIRDVASVATSFPNFVASAREVGLQIERCPTPVS